MNKAKPPKCARCSSDCELFTDHGRMKEWRCLKCYGKNDTK